MKLICLDLVNFLLHILQAKNIFKSFHKLIFLGKPAIYFVIASQLGKAHQFDVRQIWVQILTLPLIYYVLCGVLPI